MAFRLTASCPDETVDLFGLSVSTNTTALAVRFSIRGLSRNCRHYCGLTKRENEQFVWLISNADVQILMTDPVWAVVTRLKGIQPGHQTRHTAT